MSHLDEFERSEYLWSKRGPPEPELVRLERLLSPYAFHDRAPRRKAHRHTRVVSGRVTRRRRSRWTALVAALALAFLIVGIGLTVMYYRLQWPTGRAWSAKTLAGNATVDGQPLNRRDRLARGGVLQTANHSVVQLDVARIGRVLVGQNSRVELIATRTGDHRLRLDHGSLSARVWAPPFSFGVETQAADAYDVGCEFRLSMTITGTGQIHVMRGWVMLSAGGIESMIPQGAQADISPRSGIGTPYDSGATPAFRSALRAIDAAGSHISADDPAIGQLIAASRPRDAITFISLLSRYSQLANTRIYNRAVATLSPPAGLTRNAVKHRDSKLMDAWWNKLPYPRMKRWWLQWPDILSSKPNKIELRREKLL